MKSLVIEMVKKAPKPDKMGAYGDDTEMEQDGPEQEEMDEDADATAAKSAMADYIKAVKSGNVDESLALFKELVGHCT